MGDLTYKEQLLNFASSDKPLPVDKTILAKYIFHSKYTNAKFREVKDECLGLRHTYINKTSTLGSTTFYKADEKIPTPIARKRWKSYTLTIYKEKGDFSCSCKLFEFRGILCKHIIRIIELEDIAQIPEKYILNCWRKDVVRRYEGIHVAYYDLDSNRVQKEVTDKIRIELEDSMGIEHKDNDAQCWWDESSCKVFGRRRVRPREQNKRHLKKSVVPVEDGTKDPVDKRKAGRGKNTRIPNPAEKGKLKKKFKYTPEEIAHNEEIIRNSFGTLNGRWHGTAPYSNISGIPNVGGISNNTNIVAREGSSSIIRDSNAMSYGSQPTMNIDQSEQSGYNPEFSVPINERDPYWLRSTQQ
ncbi:protein FAR1-RELATED SEQUENCE 1-like [Chenopodium quinoa]|uniref:protein FAR1-RELATED SEQUENCE 1-like n=1 Tax=Chenopodium quinoa TaxID=63459 RepID=UPI000B7958E0|nr:protein FAR1-RELATED SEQUENCE 1-like [Chenopodium quinoa]